MFPKDFLWGASTAAHQVEGGNHNDWSEWEQARCQHLADTAMERLGVQSGYGFATAQAERFKTEISDPQNYISGQSSDHYHRFREDFDLAKSLDHNAHRFSIEWSRIEPEPGQFDEKELDHYAEVIEALKSRGLEPVVTLWHWTLPVWFSERGGFETKDSPALFARYAAKVIERLGHDVTYWITLNEPTVMAGSAYYLGIFPPQQKNLFKYWRVLRHLIKAHRLAAAAIKQLQPRSRVGIAHSYVLFHPSGSDPIASLYTRLADYVWNGYVLGRVAASSDFIGINHYFGMNYRLWRQVRSDRPTSDLGWVLDPATLYLSVKKLSRYKLPLLVTEHGCADAADKHRGKFITESLQWLDRAMTEGCNVLGYLHWSLLDNFEWDKGFWPRFGLIQVDYRTLQRTIRPSARQYAELIQKYSGQTQD